MYIFCQSIIYFDVVRSQHDEIHRFLLFAFTKLRRSRIQGSVSFTGSQVLCLNTSDLNDIRCSRSQNTDRLFFRSQLCSYTDPSTCFVHVWLNIVLLVRIAFRSRSPIFAGMTACCSIWAAIRKYRPQINTYRPLVTTKFSYIHTCYDSFMWLQNFVQVTTECGTSLKNTRQTELVRWKNITIISYIVFKFYSKFIEQGVSDNFRH
jgi:hypothetical protein